VSLTESLAARIAAEGPLRLDAWMAACNAAYYGAADPLGRDFTTAPEISQMFGELIGGWIADLWLRAGRPPVRLVELGPGRGTLMADAQRVLARVPGWDAPLHLVETSPTLRALQGRALSQAQWHDALAEVPDDRALLLVANEFFDALPVRQRRAGKELHVGAGFQPVWEESPGPDGEWSDASAAIAAQIGARLSAHGGAALIIDYGNAGPAMDTLQAIRAGVAADPFAAPGQSDLTAHVDFAALARAAGVPAFGPVGQGPFLHALGIVARAEALKRGRDSATAAAISAALVRLTAPGQMGALFKAMALIGRGWPAPAGFGMESA
jgi:SAM-dependent MidA family methyltransferase